MFCKMILNKFIKYMATEKGRKLTMYFICTSGMVTFSANYLPHTLLVQTYKGILQGYKYGEAREVTDKLKRRFEYAMILCKCTEFEKKNLEPFIAFGFDVMQIGTTKSRYGGHVGIPTNYMYDKVSDIERSEIRARHKEINWSSMDGQNLQNSLILTESEQIFGMAQSILELKSHKVLLTSLYPPICLLSMYGAGIYLNQKMNFYAKPLAIRLCLYSILTLFGFGWYSFMTDYTQVSYETLADKELAALGPAVTATGISFYNKILQKNVALRNLIGENVYTAKGNEHFYLRQKRMPLTVRKSFFEMKLKEFEDAKSENLQS